MDSTDIPNLHKSAIMGDIAGLRRAIQEGCDLDSLCTVFCAPHEPGRTALDISMFHKKHDCVIALVQAGATVDLESVNTKRYLTGVCERGVKDVLQAILQSGRLDVKATAIEHCLVHASRHGEKLCVELLLNSGVYVDARNPKRPSYSLSGETSLIAASFENESECVQLLLNANADVNAVDFNGKSALMAASGKGHESCVKLLLQWGADVKHENNRTSVIAASSFGRKKCLDMLIAAGADNVHKLESTEEHKLTQEAKRLMVLTRKAIRDHLMTVDTHANLFTKVPQLLNLPNALKKYLLYNITL